MIQLPSASALNKLRELFAGVDTRLVDQPLHGAGFCHFQTVIEAAYAARDLDAALLAVASDCRNSGCRNFVQLPTPHTAETMHYVLPVCGIAFRLVEVWIPQGDERCPDPYMALNVSMAAYP